MGGDWGFGKQVKPTALINIVLAIVTNKPHISVA